MDPRVDKYLSEVKKFGKELTKLRKIILSCGLTEEVRWGAPCYTFQKKNVLIIGDLKDCCVLSFFKGVLLSDHEKILAKPGKNTQSARLIKFTNIQEIKNVEAVLKTYIFEAIENEKAGLNVKFNKPEVQEAPIEFKKKLAEMPSLKTAFKALSPGRQRAYLLHFSEAKLSKTRTSRIESCIPQILRGDGLHDKYTN